MWREQESGSDEEMWLFALHPLKHSFIIIELYIILND